jgi:hypothetical protein
MYCLFAGSSYYPEGGMDDFVGQYSTLRAAKTKATKGHYDWCEIAIIVDGKLVRKTYRDPRNTKVWKDFV